MENIIHNDDLIFKPAKDHDVTALDQASALYQVKAIYHAVYQRKEMSYEL